MTDRLLPPILAAAECGNTELVEVLMREGANVMSRNVFGMNCMHVAVNRGYYDLVDFLSTDIDLVNSECVERDYDSRCGIYDGYTPLHFNADNGNLKITELLVHRGAKVNTKEHISGRTPLLIAVAKGRVELVKVLLSLGADVQVRDRHGNSALHIATDIRCEELLEICEIMIDAKVNVDSRNKRGETPLHIACRRNKGKVTDLLLHSCSDINVKNKHGQTPLHVAMEETCQTVIVKSLLRCGARCDLCDNNGDTPLHIACRKNNLPHIDLLLQTGCDVNLENNNHFTPLHLATKCCYKMLVEKLLLAGANVHKPTKLGETAFTMALEVGSIDIAKLLLKRGSDIHVRDKNNHTLLQHAVSRGNFNVVQFLLKCGVDIDTFDDGQRTALDIAYEYRNLNIIKFLLDYGGDINNMRNHVAFSSEYSVYCKDITVVFFKHLIRLKCLNSYISTENTTLFTEEALKECFNVNVYRNDCLNELERLKLLKFQHTYISLYDFLKKKLHQLVVCLQNENVVNACSENYKFMLPIYGNMIRLKFEKGLKRKELLDQSRIYFNKVAMNLPLLPNYCTEKILHHLSNQDLQALIDVYTLPNLMDG